jgi:tetratricopeptide (TPR) repeat protein
VGTAPQGGRPQKQACLDDLIALRDSLAGVTPPPQSWLDALDLAKSMVTNLQAQTESLNVSGNNAAKEKSELLTHLSAALGKLQPTSSPDTIYGAALDVYDYIRDLYHLADKHSISMADRDHLADLATDAFDQVIEVYLSHPGLNQPKPSATVKKLDEAIYKLQKSLDPALWVDDTHLNPKQGNKVFDKEKEGVHKLEELLKDKKNTIPDDTLVGFIHCFTSVDRQLAVAAIDEAAAHGAKPEKIAKAREDLAKGDADAAKGDYDHAIDHYKHAWEQTGRIRIDPMPGPAGALRLVFYVNDETARSVEASTDLINWTKIGSAQPDKNGVVTFDVPNDSAFSTRFYRVVEQ